jgi:Kef-type K+ transport system membrane component KefB
MSEPIILAIVAAISAFLGGLIQAWYARVFERSKYIRDSKTAAYGEFMAALSAVTAHKKGTAENAKANQWLIELRCRIPLYASSEVVQKLADLFENQQQFTDPEPQKMLAEAILAMRRDLGQSSEQQSPESFARLLFGSKEEV